MGFLNFYQKYISPLSPPSCRYYPTCSEYGQWQFKHNNFFVAFLKTTLRILRCNKLFAGGIDYPVVPCPKKYSYSKTPIKVKYWFVPDTKGKCKVLKVFE